VLAQRGKLAKMREAFDDDPRSPTWPSACASP
jgi:hypothetical protein